MFDIVDEDRDGRVQADEVLLLVMTAIEGENLQENTQNNTESNRMHAESTEDINTKNECTQGNTEASQTNGHDTEDTQNKNTKEIIANNENTIKNTQISRTNGHSTEGKNASNSNTEKLTKKEKIQVNKEEVKQVLESIEKDENGKVD